MTPQAARMIALWQDEEHCQALLMGMIRECFTGGAADERDDFSPATKCPICSITVGNAARVQCSGCAT